MERGSGGGCGDRYRGELVRCIVTPTAQEAIRSFCPARPTASVVTGRCNSDAIILLRPLNNKMYKLRYFRAASLLTWQLWLNCHSRVVPAIKSWSCTSLALGHKLITTIQCDLIIIIRRRSRGTYLTCHPRHKSSHG